MRALHMSSQWMNNSHTVLSVYLRADVVIEVSRDISYSWYSYRSWVIRPTVAPRITVTHIAVTVVHTGS